jgi:predicted NUDIX family NTP pyrophosphohydrolase
MLLNAAGHTGIATRPRREKDQMPKCSAGILLYRKVGSGIELLLVHPGGPFWAKKDQGAWSIPKGEHGAGEDPLAAAKREFAEEVGDVPPEGPYLDLGSIAQPGHKTITVFAIEGTFDATSLRSNLFEMEWPPKSGRMQSFPEVDRAQWFPPNVAREKILTRQAHFIDQLCRHLRV